MRKQFLKPLFSLLILFALVYWVGARDLLSVLASVQPVYIVYLLGISAVLIWLSCVKWQLFIRAWGHDAHILFLMRLYVIGNFYNTFAPSSLAGDIARSLHLGHKLENKTDAFIVTFLERLTGFLAMVLLATVFVFIGAESTKGVEYVIFAVATLTLIGTLICFSRPGFRLFSSLTLKTLALLRLRKLSDKIDKLLRQIEQAMEMAHSNRLLFVKAMFWSLMFHLGTVVNTYTAAKAIGWDNPSFTGLCVTVPLVLLVSIAPLTPSGIGIQEGAFVYLLRKIGATSSQALGVGLVLRVKNLFTAFIGYLLWAWGPKPKDTSTQ